jgi:hypothetical protein
LDYFNKAQDHEKGMQLYFPRLGGQDQNLEQGFTNYWLLK